MAELETTVLSAFISEFDECREIASLKTRIAQLKKLPSRQQATQELPEIYHQAASFLEQEMQKNGYPESQLEQHQRLFREMESQIADFDRDIRLDFIIVIPIADRPQHLENCLDTLLSLCQRFLYGGRSNQRYRKIRVVIADDSKTADNRRQIRKTTQHFDHLGLTTLYFGPTEQIQQLNRSEVRKENALVRILGDHPTTAFYHKGASVTRNISYLKLNELISENNKSLIWFLDSDQEFRVNTDDRDKAVYAINYFHQIDRIFRKTGAKVLTGKVVGDPPVSPAVMAGNFLDDLIGFLSGIAQRNPHQPCTFHNQTRQKADDAAYHDMAELFGFDTPHEPFHYQCTLAGEHDHTHCLADFAGRLNAFFDGEHPTRKTHYTYQPLASSIQPARTVYTGNYILTAEALVYFIPFATLGLRMAGPVLGRILQSELGTRFISANLPLLHKRTLQGSSTAEFRTGVERHDARIDLSGEFERQFFGDVMLFTIQELTRQDYPGVQLDDALVRQTVDRTEVSMRQKYRTKQAQIIAKIDALNKLLNDDQNWWRHDPHSTRALAELNRFLDNMTHNFGRQASAYRLIDTASYREQRRWEISEAIRHYGEDRNHWLKLLGENNEHLCP